MKQLRIEVDIKCKKNKVYRQLLKTRILTKEKGICGFQTFGHKELDANEGIEWLFGVKIFEAEQAPKDVYLTELDHFIEIWKSSASVATANDRAQ